MVNAPMCVNVCLGQAVPWPPAGLSFLPEGVGEGKLSGYVEPYQNHPCQRLGVGETQEQVVSSVVQVLMFWGHGCIRRGKQRGERSDLAPRGARSPLIPQGNHRIRPPQRLLGPTPTLRLLGWGLALERCLRCVWSEGKGR